MESLLHIPTGQYDNYPRMRCVNTVRGGLQKARLSLKILYCRCPVPNSATSPCRTTPGLLRRRFRDLRTHVPYIARHRASSPRKPAAQPAPRHQSEVNDGDTAASHPFLAVPLSCNPSNPARLSSSRHDPLYNNISVRTSLRRYPRCTGVFK